MKRQSPRTQNHEQSPLTMDEEARGNFTAFEHDRSPHDNDDDGVPSSNIHQQKKKSRLRDQLHSFKVMSMPYFQENKQGRILFAIMVILTLANSAVRVFCK